MVCARPVSGILGSRAFTLYQTDTKLTENTILQMFAKGVECVAVYTDEASVIAVKDADPFEARLSEIFGEFPTEDCRAFMDALVIARPTLG